MLEKNQTPSSYVSVQGCREYEPRSPCNTGKQSNFIYAPYFWELAQRAEHFLTNHSLCLLVDWERANTACVARKRRQRDSGHSAASRTGLTRQRRSAAAPWVLILPCGVNCREPQWTADSGSLFHRNSVFVTRLVLSAVWSWTCSWNLSRGLCLSQWKGSRFVKVIVIILFCD